ncbi:hypothetical protein EYR40_009673 [Pleurotus pulmonarius]|nr:hypothetical protein EYR38_009235 [Pleurotus pulmonarius]KAF4591073.1 hypothetical protein EYR40_009673 [Pleurotus pulmonarius]
MSSRIPISSRYGLRSRKGQNEEIPDRSESELTDVSTKSTPVGHLSRPTSAASRRSYSEVVAAHIPVETVRPTETIPGGPENGSAAEAVQSDEKTAKKGVQADTADDDDSSTWTTVTRGNRRSHSVSSLDRRRNTLNVEQLNSIDSAYNNLSKEEREKLSRREARVNADTSADNRAPSPRDIPSKGKNPDPRNWGNLNFAAEELDPIAQARAFAAWKATQAKRRPDTSNVAEGSRDHAVLATNPDTGAPEASEQE